jgi:itaconate CoA-transferase
MCLACRARSDAAAPDLMLPLQDITVVSLEQAIAAPFCTRQLADLGARVIKIERPGKGDFARDYDQRVRGLSSHFVWANRSKESLCLDLKSSDAPEVLQRLLAKADVLVQNLAPGATERLGLSYAQLEARYPRLIVCDISGYGSDGPYRDRKAYDLLIQAESGLVSITGTEESPSKTGPSIADISGAMYAFSGILAALLQRSQTGRGSHLDISLLESLVEWNGFPLYYSFEGQPPPARSGADHATIYPYGQFRTGDGRQVMLGLQNEREWNIFCTDVLQQAGLAVDERFASNARRSSNRVALKQQIEAVFGGLTAEQVTARLEAAGVATARLNSLAEVWDHPQLRSRQRWRQVQTARGTIPALQPPGLASGAEARMDPVPALGQHTSDILLELGFSAQDAARISAASLQ